MVQRMIADRGRDHARMFSRPTVVFVRAALAAALLIGLLVLSLSRASAQDRSQAREACEADYRRLCVAVVPGGGRVRRCLEDHVEALSAPCRQILVSRSGK
jgi:hypothetical protein